MLQNARILQHTVPYVVEISCFVTPLFLYDLNQPAVFLLLFHNLNIIKFYFCILGHNSNLILWLRIHPLHCRIKFQKQAATEFLLQKYFVIDKVVQQLLVSAITSARLSLRKLIYTLSHFVINNNQEASTVLLFLIVMEQKMFIPLNQRLFFLSGKLLYLPFPLHSFSFGIICFGID